MGISKVTKEYFVKCLPPIVLCPAPRSPHKQPYYKFWGSLLNYSNK